MPQSKHALLRMKVLDRCLHDRTHKYTIKGLMEACNEKYGEIMTITALNTIRADVRTIDTDYGEVEEYHDGKDRRIKYYRYKDPDFSIYNVPLKDDQKAALMQTLRMLAGVEGLPQGSWLNEIMEQINSVLDFNVEDIDKAIGFDKNPYLEGQQFFSLVYDHIIKNSPIALTYKNFRSQEPDHAIISPYFLKEYNRRWFLLAWNHDLGMLSNYALDRIVAVEPTDQAFIPRSQDFDLAEYYDDMIGVSRRQDSQPEEVRLWVSSRDYPYIKTKPLHGSQKDIEVAKDGMIITIDVILNYELEQQLLSFGAGVKVLSPESLVEKMKGHANRLAEIYK